MATIKILANARRAYRTGGLSALVGVFVRRLALSEQTDAWMRWCMSRMSSSAAACSAWMADDTLASGAAAAKTSRAG